MNTATTTDLAERVTERPVFYTLEAIRRSNPKAFLRQILLSYDQDQLNVLSSIRKTKEYRNHLISSEISRLAGKGPVIVSYFEIFRNERPLEVLDNEDDFRIFLDTKKIMQSRHNGLVEALGPEYQLIMISQENPDGLRKKYLWITEEFNAKYMPNGLKISSIHKPIVDPNVNPDDLINVLYQTLVKYNNFQKSSTQPQILRGK